MTKQNLSQEARMVKHKNQLNVPYYEWKATWLPQLMQAFLGGSIGKKKKKKKKKEKKIYLPMQET